MIKRTRRSTPLLPMAAFALLPLGCGATTPPSDPGPVAATTATTVEIPTAAAPSPVSPTATSVVSAAPSAIAAASAPTSSAADPCRATIADVPGDHAATRQFECPTGCSTGSSWLWGDVVYTADSYVCVAAIHAGAISATSGGKVFVEPLPGQPSYPGSVRNGVTSREWSSFAGSVRIHAVGVDGKPKELPIPAPRPVTMDCNTSARTLVTSGTSATATCPSGCATTSWVYGAGPYTDDSSVCAAAIHAGVIPSSGGDVRVTLGPKLAGHQASTKNGVTTRAWSGEYVTFTLSKP